MKSKKTEKGTTIYISYRGWKRVNSRKRPGDSMEKVIMRALDALDEVEGVEEGSS